MNKNKLLWLVVSLLLAGAAMAQEAMEEVVVTGSRSEGAIVPGTSLRRPGDFILLTVQISNDSREEKMRTEEINATLRAMLSAASKDKSIELSVIGDNNLVLPLRLDSATLQLGKGKRPGRPFGRRRRQLDLLGCGHQRQHHPRVFTHVTPADERQATFRMERVVQIGKRCGGIAEEHHSETRVDGIDAGRREGMSLRIRVDETDIGSSRHPGAALGLRQHHRGNVHAGDGSGGADPAGKLDGRIAAATTDVENA